MSRGTPLMTEIISIARGFAHTREQRRKGEESSSRDGIISVARGILERGEEKEEKRIKQIFSIFNFAFVLKQIHAKLIHWNDLLI